jgi:hypothetical protein
MGLKNFVLGLSLGFVLFGCATIAFPYRYYGLDAVSYDGSLLGPKPAQDLSLKECEPDLEKPGTPAKRGKCVVMLAPEFFKLKADHLKLQSDLIACQKGSK